MVSNVSNPSNDTIIENRKKYGEVVKQLNTITTNLGVSGGLPWRWWPIEKPDTIRETFDKNGDGMSVSEIWGWDEDRWQNNLYWLNLRWWDKNFTYSSDSSEEEDEEGWAPRPPSRCPY